MSVQERGTADDAPTSVHRKSPLPSHPQGIAVATASRVVTTRVLMVGIGFLS